MDQAHSVYHRNWNISSLPKINASLYRSNWGTLKNKSRFFSSVIYDNGFPYLFASMTIQLGPYLRYMMDQL